MVIGTGTLGIRLPEAFVWVDDRNEDRYNNNVSFFKCLFFRSYLLHTDTC